MRSRRKLLIVVAILFLIVLVRPSFHWAKDEASTETSSGFGCSTGNNAHPYTYSRFVIVVPETNGRARDMQARVADELKSELTNRGLAYTIIEAGHGWSIKSPEVFVCSSREDALQRNPDFLIFVRCKKWQFSFLPFIKSYSADVEIRGGDPSYWQQVAAVSMPGEKDPDARFVSGWPQPKTKRFLTYNFNAHVTTDGKMQGIFSASYLTSSVAKSIAKTAADNLEKQVKQEVDKFMSDKRNKVRRDGSV
jgi:hypothetical protein